MADFFGDVDLNFLIRTHVSEFMDIPVISGDSFIVNSKEGLINIKDVLLYSEPPISDSVVKVNTTNPRASRPFVMCGFSPYGCIIADGERPVISDNSGFVPLGYRFTNSEMLLRSTDAESNS